MTSREQHPEDLPWNDAPADSELPPGTEEPEPAEVVGDEGEEVDSAEPPVPDPYEKYRQESLDQRLKEEERDTAAGASPDEEAGGLVDPDEGGEAVYRADASDDEDDDEPGAEDAAIHVRDEDDI
jgi:hypothetical protein